MNVLIKDVFESYFLPTFDLYGQTVNFLQTAPQVDNLNNHCFYSALWAQGDATARLPAGAIAWYFPSNDLHIKMLFLLLNM
jgi:hypothetical protein